jgi:hypothetical protein
MTTKPPFRHQCNNAAITLQQRCNNAATTLQQRCNNCHTEKEQERAPLSQHVEPIITW